MDLANKECQSKCKEDEDCSFYAVNEANKYCTLFKTCHESDREVPRNRYSIFQKIEIGKRSPSDERVDMYIDKLISSKLWYNIYYKYFSDCNDHERQWGCVEASTQKECLQSSCCFWNGITCNSKAEGTIK